MKLIFKTLATIGIGFLMYLSFVFGQIQLLEGKHIIYPYLDTKFALDYSPENFNKIQIGMSLEKVKEIIGEPLYSENNSINSVNINLYYTGDGKLLSKKKTINSYPDLAWYRSSLEIDEDKKVVSIDKGWSFD